MISMQHASYGCVGVGELESTQHTCVCAYAWVNLRVLIEMSWKLRPSRSKISYVCCSFPSCGGAMGPGLAFASRAGEQAQKRGGVKARRQASREAST